MKQLLIGLTTTGLLLSAVGCGDDSSSTDTTVATTVAAAPPAETTAALTTTVAPETTVAETVVETTVASAVSDDEAAAAAFALVFDSTVEFADKADHLEDAAALQATVEAYTTAGSAMGGISLVPTATVVDGDAAAITYDVMFGTASAYTDQTGTIAKVGEVWVVSRTEFCAFMASARNACPA